MHKPPPILRHVPYNRYILLPSHVRFLTNPELLEKWTHYNLDERCVLFHRQFPDMHLSRSQLSKLYKKHKIRKKKIRMTKLMTKKQEVKSKKEAVDAYS